MTVFNFKGRFEGYYFVLMAALIGILMLCFFPNKSLAKYDYQYIINNDSTRKSTDSNLVHVDTLVDSLAKVDTSINGRIQQKEQQLGIKIDRNGPDKVVESTSKDSALIDLDSSRFYLFGDGEVKQQGLDFKAGKVDFDQKRNLLHGSPEYDSTGKITSTQSFQQGSETVKFDSITFNYKTKRALMRNARSVYGEGHVLSQQIKRNPDESVYGWQNIYTTCDLDTPHFGIRAKRIKIIPGKIIASGPANLTIAGIPTPLFFPFGIFPIRDQEHSGFVIPTFTNESKRGMGLVQGGYYFHLNDNFGLMAKMDIYAGGSWGVHPAMDYVSRYHYSGNFKMDYSYIKSGEPYESDYSLQKAFNVDWTHQMDTKAHPGTTLTASVHFGTSNSYIYNQLVGPTQLNNTYNSSISYAKTWVGKPYSLSVALRHSQTTQSHALTITLPEFNFNVSQFTPFAPKNIVGLPKWYQKITTSYSISGKNSFNIQDTNFSFSNLNSRNLSNGIVQTLNLQSNYTILRYVNLSFSLPYREYWNSNKMQVFYNSSNGTYDTLEHNGFYASRDFSFSTSLSTRIYGMKLFEKGKIAGIRHVMTPSISFNYTPGFANSPFNNYYNLIDRYGNSTYQTYYYRSAVGYPNPAQPVGSIGFNLGNTLQLKTRNGDTTKIVSILDGLDIGTSYNMVADSNRLAPITVAARTTFMNLINLSASSIFNPYVYENGVMTRHYLLGEGKGLATMRNASLTAGVTLSSDKFSTAKQKQATDSLNSLRMSTEEGRRLLQNGGMDDYYDFNVTWSLNVNMSLQYYKLARAGGLPDSNILTPNLTFNGSFKPSERWMVNFSSGYDFTNKQIGYTSVNISRDLHCWQMMLNLAPFGSYKSFNFTLQVKASILQDLKLTKRRSIFDN